MTKYRTIVLVLRSGGDFSFADVELISRHINIKWQSDNKFRIICLWDKATQHYKLGNLELLPLDAEFKGTWARMQLYSPEMEKYRPFLYIDLDTAIINSIENIFDLVKDESKFIVLEDFWQKGQLATGLVWFPANSDNVDKVWKARSKAGVGARMDNFLRKVLTPDAFWQDLTDTILDFKPKYPKGKYLMDFPETTNLVCFHGKPRIHDIQEIKWVKNYVEYE